MGGQVFSRASLEIKLVVVRCPGIERDHPFSIDCADGILLRKEICVEAKVGREHECATMIGIIAHKKICHRCLGTGCLDGWMRINDARGGVETGIGNAPDADLPIVIRHMLQKIFNRVIHVRGVVDILRGRLVVDVRTHLDKLALRLVSAAHILIDKDVTGLLKFVRRAKALLVLIFTIRGDRIGRAIHHDRIGDRHVFRHVDGRKQLDPVTHRDPVFILCVVCLYVVFSRGLCGILGEGR